MHEGGRTIAMIMTIIMVGAGLLTVFQMLPFTPGTEDNETPTADPDILSRSTDQGTRTVPGEEILHEQFDTVVGWDYTDNSNTNSSINSDGAHCVVNDYGNQGSGYWGPIVERRLNENISTNDDFIIDVRYYADLDYFAYGVRVRVDMMDDDNNSIAWLEYKDVGTPVGKGKTYLNAEDRRIYEFKDFTVLSIPITYDRKLSIARESNSWFGYVDGGRKSGLTLDPNYNCSKIRLSMQKTYSLYARDPKVDFIILKKGDLHPDTPTGFNVTVRPMEREVKLIWDRLSGTIHDGYRIYRTTGGRSVLVGVYPRDTTESYDRGMEKGLNYSYSICAYNTFNESIWSAPIIVNITTVPSEMMNLSAEKFNDRIELQWQPPDDDGGSPLLNYTLYRKNGTDHKFILNNYTPGDSLYSYVDYNITLGNSYTYFITATNEIGESKKDEGVEVIFIFPPGAPENLTVEYADNCVNLSWDPPEFDGGGGILRYRIYRNISIFGLEEFLVNVSGTETVYKDLKISENGTYTYRVTSVNAITESGYGPPASVNVTIVFKVPGSPSNLRVQFENEKVNLTWERPSNTGGLDINEYRIYRGEETGNRSYIKSVPGDVTEYQDMSVLNNKKYVFV